MNAASNRQGLRGYIAARTTGGRSAPQHIQQLVIRDYCARIGKPFLLSATEYLMPGCTMVLDDVLKNEIAQIEGMVMYSIFLMPESAAKRQQLYARLVETGAELHTAVEGIVIRDMTDAARIEDLFLLWDVQARQQETDYQTLVTWDQNNAAA